MKLELESNSERLDAVINAVEAAVAEGNQRLASMIQTTTGSDASEVVARLRQVREAIRHREAMVVREAWNLDHEIARTMGSPGREAIEPVRSLLQLLGSVPLERQDFSYAMSGHTDLVEVASLKWSFSNAAISTEPGNAPQPPA